LLKERPFHLVICLPDINFKKNPIHIFRCNS
jgi:hypothetical protein